MPQPIIKRYLNFVNIVGIVIYYITFFTNHPIINSFFVTMALILNVIPYFICLFIFPRRRYIPSRPCCKCKVWDNNYIEISIPDKYIAGYSGPITKEYICDQCVSCCLACKGPSNGCYDRCYDCNKKKFIL